MRCSRRRQWLDAAHGTTAAAAMLAEAAAEEAAAAAALGVRRVGAVEDLRCLDDNLDGGLGRRCASFLSADPCRCHSGCCCAEPASAACPSGVTCLHACMRASSYY